MARKPPKTGVCARCGKEKPIISRKSMLCNSCHVVEYKKRTGYKGPVRTCIVCGEVTNIHSNEMCRSCYNRQYAKDHHEEILERKRQDRKENPEKYKNWDKTWKERNREYIREKDRQYYQAHIEKRRAEKRKYYREHAQELKDKNRRKYIENNTSIGKKQKSDDMIQSIPDLKKVWIIEFLSTVYHDRAERSKDKFLRDISRLLNFLKEHNETAYKGGWNMVSLTDIEQCQIETSALKDSLRVFFKWLKQRKYVTLNLADAIPTQTSKRKISEINIENLSEVVKRWYHKDGNLEVRIACLLIIFHLCTVHQLRNLKVSDLQDGKIFLHNDWHEVDEKLWQLIEKYKKWRTDFYFEFTPEYFFITGYTVTSKTPVEGSHFAKLFKANSVGLSPSDLRKAMIYFHKNKTGMDPFKLAVIAGISPRMALKY